MTDALVNWLQNWGELHLGSAAVLALVFLVTGLILIPRTFLCLASGAMFGLSAIPIILPSTTLSAVIGFLLARYFFADWLRRRVDRRPRVRAVMDAIDSEGWRIVALLRFGSPLPSTVQTYLFGITRIGLVPFTLATLLFTIPQVCLYVWLGAAGRAALLDDGSSGLSRGLMLVAALTLTTAMILVTRKTRLALQRETSAPNPKLAHPSRESDCELRVQKGH
jgi:uncharacterized membrane protein YdjX (TVP38/TMEM64 family)